MPRGKATFETMDSINTVQADDYHAPDYNKKMEVDLNTNGSDKYSELDPVAKINKGFSDVEDSLVMKSSTMSPRSEGRVYSSADSDWNKRENAIKNERQAKLVPELKKNYGIQEDINKRSFERNIENEKATNAMYGMLADEGRKSQKLRNKLSSAERKLTKGKIAAVTAIPLAASAIAGAYKYGKSKAETKGFSFPKKIISDKTKEAAKTSAALGLTGYGVVESSPEDNPGVITENKAFKLESLKTPAATLGAGFIGSDIANRLQDSRAKKNREGMVGEIVDQLKRSKR